MILDRSLKGGFYLTLFNILAQIVSIGVNILLARLLEPEDFGLVALVATSIGVITVLGLLGLGKAIIYYQNVSENQLSTIYWLNWISAIVIFAFLVVSADQLAIFYEEPELPHLIKLGGLNLFLTPIYIVQYKLLEKDLDFKRLTRINLVSVVISSVLVVFLAVLGCGIYSLILQGLILNLVKSIQILSLRIWTPSYVFKLSEIRIMLSYSFKLKLNDIVLFLSRDIDYLLIGKYYAATTLGYYSFAYNIMYNPVKRISYVFSQVLFPSFSSIQGERRRILNGYYTSLNLVSIVSFPLMVLISLNTEFLLHFVFGSKWDGAIPIVQILSIAGAIQSIQQFGGVIFSSVGKPEYSALISTSGVLLTIAAIFLGAHFGILVVAYLLLCSKIVLFIILLIILKRVINLSFKQVVLSIKGPFITSIILFAIALAFKVTGNHQLALIKFMTMLCSIGISTWYFNSRLIMKVLESLKSKSSL